MLTAEVLHTTAVQKHITDPQSCWGWKRPLRSPSPTPPWPLSHVPRCHIRTLLEHLLGVLTPPAPWAVPQRGSANPADPSAFLGSLPAFHLLLLLSLQLYRRLSEVLGLNDETMVLSVFIGKM